MKYVLHFGPDSLNIELEGDFSFMDTRVFHRMLDAIVSQESHSVVRLNVKRLSSVDSTGLRLLMMAHDAAKKKHRSLVFEQPQGQVFDRLSEAATCNLLHIAA